jgi:hypothetical protein
VKIQDEIELERRVLNARDDLARMLSSLPKGFSSWSYGRTLDFKESCARAKKICSGARSKPHVILGAVAELRHFYEETT